MFEVTNRTALPYSAICYITSTWPNGTTTRGSGTVVGVNDVLTALHVVYNAALGGWATGVTVYPGVDTVPFTLSPAGSFANWGRFTGRVANWDTNGDGLLSEAEAQYDMAVIGMKSRIGDITGIVGTAAEPFDFDGTMAGYPARGTGLMAEAVSADASTYYGVYEINSSLGAGASGGPLLHTSGGNTYVSGVLSSGNAANTATTYAGLFGAGTWDWLTAALAGNDDLIGALGLTLTGTIAPDALVGGPLADALSGNGGNDSFTGNGGDDTLVGGDGIDTAIYSGVRASYTVAVSGLSTKVTDKVIARDGADSLASIERLRFTNVSLALDTSATGNAGITAKVIGAVFGAAALANRDYVGIGLKQLDAGLSYEGLLNLALNAQLGQNFTTEAEVALLVANLTGTPASAADIAYYTGLVGAGVYTQTVLGQVAAEHALNLGNIQFSGLAATGIEYTFLV